MGWDLMPGEVIRRKALHGRFGGRRQGGIAPSASTPHVMVFSDTKTGAQYGYHDRWENGIFHYTGEGQLGPQRMISGNKAILDHRDEGRSLRVFKGVRGEVRYLGAFELEDDPWYWADAKDLEGAMRPVIVFRMRSVEAPPADTAIANGGTAPGQPSNFGNTYRRADEAATAAAREPFSVDPNEIDRYTRGHARTQNALAEYVAGRGIEPQSPTKFDPDFDLGWVDGGVWYVAEVKSLTSRNESRQLRLGLGQVLDYQDALLKRHPSIRAVLAVEHQPNDSRWVSLCERHDVVLVWPGTMDVLRSRALSG